MQTFCLAPTDIHRVNMMEYHMKYTFLQAASFVIVCITLGPRFSVAGIIIYKLELDQCCLFLILCLRQEGAL